MQVDLRDAGLIRGWEDPLKEGTATHSTPVISPGEVHGQRSLEGCSPQCHKDTATIEASEHACTRAQIQTQAARFHSLRPFHNSILPLQKTILL